MYVCVCIVRNEGYAIIMTKILCKIQRENKIWQVLRDSHMSEK
jgi:hypothetical protein